MHRKIRFLLIFLALTVLLACSTLSLPAGFSDPTAPASALLASPQPSIQPVQSETPASAFTSPTVTLFPTGTPPPSATPAPPGLRFAVIGDFGQGNQAAADVANLIKGWEVDFILTVGDNNYPSGSPATIDQNIGQFYHEFIYPYRGVYGVGAERLRFFPTLGNHDWDTNQAQAYLDYFELPGNERYYDFVQGPVHFFALDTDSREPDGVGRSSIQASWLRERLASSNSIWKVVYGHHPPYSSGLRGPVDWMRWPFKEWGATVYLAGHDHFYERLEVDGMPYFTNGIGGGPIYDIGFAAAGSLVRFNDDYGAMLVVADEGQITFQLITRSGQVVDSYQIVRTALP